MLTRRALTAIGVGQCVNWGVLFYAFGVLLLPVAEDLQVPSWVVAGALSSGLFVSAILAPRVGRLVDRGLAPALVSRGGFAAALVLVLWAAVPNVFTTYLAWIALGACMAAVLYEPIFVFVSRELSDARERLRALATITVWGGLASTVFLPLTGAAIERAGWRVTVAALAAVLALTTWAVRATAFTGPFETAPPQRLDAGAGAPVRALAPADLRRTTLLFAFTSFAGTAVVTNLVPALAERSVAPATGAAIAGLLGIMQLPGRVLLMRMPVSAGPSRLLAISLVLQALGVAALAVAPSLILISCAVALFASGAGLTTLVRPYLVHSLAGSVDAGRANGLVARGQQFARAVGPAAAAAAASVVGYPVVLGSLAAALLAATAASGRLAGAQAATAARS